MYDWWTIPRDVILPLTQVISQPSVNVVLYIWVFRNGNVFSVPDASPLPAENGFLCEKTVTWHLKVHTWQPAWLDAHEDKVLWKQESFSTMVSSW